MKHICSYLFLIIFTILCLNLPVFSYDLLQELNGNTTVKPKYLPVEEAFIATITSAENQTTVSISIAPEYYLYRHLVKVSLNEGNFEIKDLPEGIFHHDDFMGDSYVFFDQLDFKISYSNLKPDSELSISYQGCTQGMCYPPVKSNIKLGEYAKQSEKNSDSTVKKEQEVNEVQKHELRDLTSDHTVEQQNYSIGSSLVSSIVFFFVGLSLAFTPCVFPMYPILSLILFGNNKYHLSTNDRKHNFPVAFSFVQGIAITYTVIGIICSYLGAQTHAFLQQPAIIIIFSLIFIALSLSMLGLYDLQIPAFITSRLQKISDNQTSHSKLGAFIIGIITSLVCSPCTTAPVSASLLYTIQHGNLVSGGMNLYLMGFGMGIPMLIIGTFGKRILPKSGTYLKTIKQLLGIFSLIVPVILLDRIIPNWGSTICITALIVSSIILVLVRHCPKFKLITVTAVISCGVLSAFLLVNHQSASKTPEFISVASLDELNREISNNDQVIVDFYATWCTSCKQYEQETFADSAVIKRIQKIRLIRIDLSEQNDLNSSISNHFKLVGLPSVALFNHHEQAIILSGFYNSKEFIEALNNYMPMAENQNTERYKK